MINRLAATLAVAGAFAFAAVAPSVAFAAGRLDAEVQPAAGALAAPASSSFPAVPASAGLAESLAIDPASATYFVSSFVTGEVYRGTVGRLASQFLPAGGAGRGSAAGVHVVDGHLLVLTGTGARLQDYEIASVRQTSSLVAPTGADLNDLTVTPDGDVYITDFSKPTIYRVRADQLAHHAGRISRWLVPAASVVPDLSGGNLNGIASTADGKHLIVDQTSNGALYRVDVAGRAIAPIRVSGGSLAGCDGMLLRGLTLYVATHADAVLELRLNRALSTARVTRRLTSPSLDLPTSVQWFDGRLLVADGTKPATAPAYQISSFRIARQGNDKETG